MFETDFEYARPTSVDEAISLLATPGSRILAGGQHLVPGLAEGEIEATILIDISRLDELRRISVTPEWLVLGAGVTLSAMMSLEVAITAPLLYAVLPSVASTAVRNRATLVGNLVVANPNSELPVALAAIDALIVMRTANDERVLPMRDFLVGSRGTALVYGELVTEVRIPLASAGQTVGAFSEVVPRASALPLVCVAVSIQVDTHGIVRVARIIAGGIESVPSRCCAHENVLIGQPIALSIALLTEASEPGLRPASELPDAEYALEVLGTLIRRAVTSAVGQFNNSLGGEPSI